MKKILSSLCICSMIFLKENFAGKTGTAGCHPESIPAGCGGDTFGTIERFAFYEETKKTYAIIATSEKALYANVMLQKGCVVD